MGTMTGPRTGCASRFRTRIPMRTFLRTTLGNFINQLGMWSQDDELMDWLRRSRLDGFTAPLRDDEGPLPETDPGPVMEAIPKLQRMLAELEDAEALVAS